MKKLKTPEERLKQLCKYVNQEFAHWNYLNTHGGQDPFWTDGDNMNLTRNHIIYAFRQIAQLCEEQGWNLPDEYYLPLPPKVPSGYMANLDKKERVERLIENGHKLTTKKSNHDDKQLTLHGW